MDQINFSKAMKSFIGYLEGTQKSAHTIKNYRLDLLSFEAFLSGERAVSSRDLTQVSRDDLEHYHEYLKSQGLKTNTRRRKLLTVQRFINFLANRNKLSDDLPSKLPTPHKVEKVPVTVDQDRLMGAIQTLEFQTELEERNRALLWVLAETGCLVSEVTQLKFENISTTKIEITGKAPRELVISRELSQALRSLRDRGRESPWIFLGFNKHGSLGGAISPRGVELLVRFYAEKLGFPDLTPRTFRHSRVLSWFKEGVAQDEIQKRLGLKTAYAFRTFAPLLSPAGQN